MALVALVIPHGFAAAEPVRSTARVASAGAAAEAPERVDNLRLQRIGTGSMRGRLVIAGSLDHLPDQGVVRDVVVRMTMTVPRSAGGWRTVGRKVLDYRLPAKVSPQDMTLRWVLGKRESRQVNRAGDAARVTVVVRESRAGGPMERHVKVAERLQVEPLAPLQSFTTSVRSTGIFIPAGYYTSRLNGLTYHLWTSEDASGAPYVGGVMFAGTSALDYTDGWYLFPLWRLKFEESGSPGPGGGYLYMSGSVPSWSYTTVAYGDPPCTMTATARGTFSASAAAVSWQGFGCKPDDKLWHDAGSVSLGIGY